MDEYDEFDELDEFDESDESDESYDEFVERAVRGRSPGRSTKPVKTASGKNGYTPPPTNPQSVTQAQLRSTIQGITNQIKTNSEAIRTLDGRLRSVAVAQDRQGTALRKELIARKKENELIRKEIQATRELAAYLPLLTKNNPNLALAALPDNGLFGGGAAGGAPTSGLQNVIALSMLLPPKVGQ